MDSAHCNFSKVLITVSPNILMYILLKKGLEKWWTENYMNCWPQRLVDSCPKSRRRPFASCSAQGWILRPSLFNPFVKNWTMGKSALSIILR